MYSLVDGFKRTLPSNDVITSVARLKHYWSRRDITDSEYEQCLNACDAYYGKPHTQKACDFISTRVDDLFTELMHNVDAHPIL